jgi:hypothetical protein
MIVRSATDVAHDVLGVYGEDAADADNEMVDVGPRRTARNVVENPPRAGR